MALWTDELKAELIQDYVDQNPTPETSTSIIKGLADKYSGTVNSIRIMLNKADVYVKVAKAPKASDNPDAPRRVSKADAIAELVAALSDAGVEADDDIINKLTGKAALYFSTAFRTLINK